VTYVTLPQRKNAASVKYFCPAAVDEEACPRPGNQ